ncbi:uncharacterized protein METZ01_LOCUS513116, partial [marine metagenome]
ILIWSLPTTSWACLTDAIGKRSWRRVTTP